VKLGKSVIQNASDFYAWAEGQSECSQIKYTFVSQEEYENSSKTTEARNKEIVAIKGTMNLHAVASVGGGRLITRTTACTCANHFNDTDGYVYNTECGWQIHTLARKSKESEMRDPKSNEPDAPEQLENVEVKVGEFVAAMYDGVAYVGKVLEIDKSDDEVQITFMEKCNKVANQYRWPSKEDSVWIGTDQILCSIPEPLPTGKTKRVFPLPDEIQCTIERKKDISLA